MTVQQGRTSRQQPWDTELQTDTSSAAQGISSPPEQYPAAHPSWNLNGSWLKVIALTRVAIWASSLGGAAPVVPPRIAQRPGAISSVSFTVRTTPQWSKRRQEHIGQILVEHCKLNWCLAYLPESKRGTFSEASFKLGHLHPKSSRTKLSQPGGTFLATRAVCHHLLDCRPH